MGRDQIGWRVASRISDQDRAASGSTPGKNRPRSYSGRLARILFTVVLVGLALAACTGGATNAGSARDGTLKTKTIPVERGGSYVNVDAPGLATMLKNRDFVLVNVHIPYQGEIDPTDLFVPYNEIERNLDRLPSDRGAKIVLYCRSGAMSDIAARTLVGLGFTNVWNLEGGMVAWKDQGYPLQDKGR